MRNDKVLDEGYLHYIRSKPCLACRRSGVDADHLKARGWKEAKRNDYSAIPLCRECHTLRGQLGNVAFCDRFQIGNLWEEVFYLFSQYMKMLQNQREPSVFE